MLHDRRQTESQNWRDYWLVKNVLAEIPIIGGFFNKKTRTEALHDAGKCTFALIGGTTVMMNVLRPTEDDPMAVQFFKMTTTMAIGMIAGKVAYNTSCSTVSLLYQYCSRNTNSHSIISQGSPSLELEKLTTLDSSESASSTRNSPNTSPLK